MQIIRFPVERRAPHFDLTPMPPEFYQDESPSMWLNIFAREAWRMEH